MAVRDMQIETRRQKNICTAVVAAE